MLTGLKSFCTVQVNSRVVRRGKPMNYEAHLNLVILEAMTGDRTPKPVSTFDVTNALYLLTGNEGHAIRFVREALSEATDAQIVRIIDEAITYRLSNTAQSVVRAYMRRKLEQFGENEGLLGDFLEGKA
jgi:hypothetical protein